MEFTSSSGYSLGVEIEFQVLDIKDLNLVPFAPLLLEQAPKILRPRLSLEFIKSILEIQTGICDDLRDVENDLLQTCALAEELAADNDFILYAASLHPFARADDQELSEKERYEMIMQELQIIGRRFISQGLHVHVGMPDGETAIKVCNLIQAFLPIFLSLSCSSPFYEGKDTGLLSYRTKLFEVLPLAGLFEYMENWNHFVDQIEDLRKYGIIGGIRDLWWDTRPNPQFGTVEIRVCDLPVKFTSILALVALIQSTAAWLAEDVEGSSALSPYLLKANKWQAARHGLEGRFVDPTAILGDHPMQFRLAAMILKSRVSPYASKLGCDSYLEHLDSIISGGTGADHMCRIYQNTGDFHQVVRAIQKEFWQ
ncbi:MAG: YbdK family carboxylate-amine ligase [Desulfofustis sp.]|nr:YbdK family carboxylate-amine ligase [Desulfofustis sp.]